ncbi:type II toxin-antitoxin system RelE/ParE family toxin [Thalassospira lohafexi]|uniref:Plasmid stabilization protein n=1 Tax=Thalassospira lohafexi TaxID=744227 RepID=A0A2N3L6J3_9PROT|nr:type II toxin-antitoxin system RelE/ParE family toxin [Thalassospira lohafexi]PKR58428.1 plasmid stabilization protein [Thalassospira lohafexi]
MKHYRVIISPKAGRDIIAAYDWLYDENPAYAAQWRDGLRHAVMRLQTLPFAHAVAPESAEFDMEIRHMLYGRGTPWRVFYCISEDQVSILHVRHGRQDYWQAKATNTDEE